MQDEQERGSSGCSQGTDLNHGAASHQVVFYGVAGGSTTGGDPQLAVDQAHMGIDGDHADDELFSNLHAGQSLREQA